MEWTVVSVIITLVGLGVAVVRPLVSLNGVITKLIHVVDALEDNFSEYSQKNSEAHGRIWERVNEQGEQINGHEVRLTLIERITEK